MSFLPVTRKDMEERGWQQLDFIFVSGDAYVDHPSFGPAILCRLLEKHGYRVGIIPQPDWHSTKDFTSLGKPRLGFLVSSGNLDSQLSRYTAAKRLRHDDSYSPGGKAGFRPERAVQVYTGKLRECWGKDVPIIIGGIEASLRRFAHYDYWADEVRPSILAECDADLLVYGMGEHQLIEIAAQLHQGVEIQNIQDVQGTCFRVPDFDYIWDYEAIASFEQVRKSKAAFAEAFRTEYLEQDAFRGKRLAQQNGSWCIVQNPPAMPLSTEEMDEIYDLPYMRTWHPMYDKAGGVPAIEEVKFSITAHRGCFGGCNFCAIISHQGRIIQPRSDASILREAKIMTEQPDFKGYIHDVGGPTANFHRTSCDAQLKRGTCHGKQCLSPDTCKNLTASHAGYLELLRKLRQLPKVKKVFIRSGIRFDYLMLAKDDFLRELCEHHISGQLKIAPEHISDRVTRLMGKSGSKVYRRFVEKFTRMNKQLGKKQYLVPYFMSSHPGSQLEDAIELAEFIKEMGYHPEQVQDFIPTPGTLSTCMWYTGLNPLTGQQVYSAKSPEEKAMQRALMQFWLPKNYELVRRALEKAGRRDLIGYGAKCLIRPEQKSGKSPAGRNLPNNHNNAHKAKRNSKAGNQQKQQNQKNRKKLVK
ncbi:MAG: YgiQ family radical SAM protein [Anaerovibrio slackiae]|uniref:YgiQ family radical SAM protein n=1 Tax=Anaerovibrio slackiae TaxID=2652309 RepID=UPI0023F0E3FB|nr:YgiQ family radical SAM protein [Anaerovibrio slackiae]MDD6164053.1 YgiQ family radical SAM protein [Anaerovibrio slackiae]